MSTTKQSGLIDISDIRDQLLIPDFREKFLNELSLMVEQKITQNPQKFWNDLYRLDVSEEKVVKAMKSPSLKGSYWDVAELILNRELQKQRK